MMMKAPGEPYQIEDAGVGSPGILEPKGSPKLGRGWVPEAVWRRSLSPGALAQGPAWLQPWHSTWSPSGTKP